MESGWKVDWEDTSCVELYSEEARSDQSLIFDKGSNIAHIGKVIQPI